MDDVVLFLEDLESASTIYLCRICHEEEFGSCKSLEAPCACSGTVKFAHRDCIQRWCNEKGNTICEICLQKFEPGYTAPPKKAQLVDEGVTIRRSLEVPRRVVATAEGEMLETEYYDEYSLPSDQSCSWWRTMALIVTGLMLMRHIIAVLNGGTEDHPFTVITLIVLRASGILLPMFILIRTITAILNNIRSQYQELDEDNESSSDEGDSEEEELQHHRVEIHS